MIYCHGGGNSHLRGRLGDFLTEKCKIETNITINIKSTMRKRHKMFFFLAPLPSDCSMSRNGSALLVPVFTCLNGHAAEEAQ